MLLLRGFEGPPLAAIRIVVGFLFAGHGAQELVFLYLAGRGPGPGTLGSALGRPDLA